MTHDNRPQAAPDTPALISILIRTTGRPEFAQALASAAAQDYPHVEIVVADAAARGDLPIAPEAAARTRVVGTGAPLARSAAANLLLREARGAGVLFLDDDDWLAPDHVSRLVAALNEAEGAAGAYAGVSCVEITPEHPQGTELRVFDAPFDADRLLVENYIPIHALLLDAQAIRHVQAVFDEGLDLYEDWDFWLQVLRAGPFVHVPGVSAFYRIHSTGAGVRMDDESRALQGLDALLQRWWPHWTPEQRRSLVGLGRNAVRLREHLAQLDDEIARMHAEAREREAYVGRVESEHSAARRELAALQHALHLRDDALALRQQALEAAQALAASQRAELDQNARQLAARAIEIEGLKQEIVNWQQHYETSRSWKITKPLRDGAELARRGKSGASTALLSAGLRAYRSRWTAPLVGLVPYGVKRAIQSRLMAASAAAPAPQEPAAPSDRVSILIPVYNHADYLDKCIRSALDQDWPEVEVVVVDDCSPDPRVREILDGLAGHPRLKLLRHERNGGICEAQNTALVNSTGGAIAFLDCDDYLAPNAISTCMRAWKDDTVYLHTGRINIDADGNEVNRIHFLSLPREDYFAENLERMYATHLKVIRRSAFAKVGLFDPRFDSAQDYEMLMRIAFHYPSSAFVHVPDFVYFHRLHGNQTTEKQGSKQDTLTGVVQREARMRRDIREGRYARKLSFIMLSYGKHSQTLTAIQGLKRTVRVPHEIVLYDNGSAQETVDFIREQIDGKFDDVKVIYGDSNLGPAQGRRKALDYATGEWIIVFDNDEWPEEGWLEELLVRAESRPDVGAVCCRVAFPDRTLQFSGGKLEHRADGTIDLALHDRGSPIDDLEACRFREVDWCPIGATLFTMDVRPFLHEGYPNVFEDAGVSFALRKHGKQLLNAPGALVWHDHVKFMPKVEMKEQYMRDRYNPQRMLTSVKSFYAENGLLIYDEYIWRENGLQGLTPADVVRRLGFEPAMDDKELVH